MALALDETIGGESANTYATLAEFNTFLDELYPAPDASVTDASDDNKNRALATACAQLSRLYWQGDKVATAQKLPWPRVGCPNPDSIDIGNTLAPLYFRRRNFPISYDTTIIPDRVKRAQMLTAYALMTEQYVVNQAQTSEVKSFEAPNVKIQFGASVSSGGGRTVSQLPQEAASLLAPLTVGVRFERA